MSEYLVWEKKEIDSENSAEVTEAYNSGFVFVRTGKGNMIRTRSVRINLSEFCPNSENRRILRKTEDLGMKPVSLPMREDDYSWEIQKLGKDFYTRKFGKGTFSANKIKQLLTDALRSNFNLLMKYFIKDEPFGYAITYENESMMHYAYPFYDLDMDTGNFGMGMMLTAIVWAKDEGKSYLYIGSASKPEDVYKLQFEGLEWFDGGQWQTDIDKLKEIIRGTN